MAKVVFENSGLIAVLLAVWILPVKAVGLPPSAPQFLLNQQLKNQPQHRSATMQGASRGGVPVIDVAVIEAMKRDAWENWKIENNSNISFDDWYNKFLSGELK